MLVLAFAVGIVCIAPFVYFASTPQYRGIVMMGNDAEDHYLARMKEVYEGHFTAANTFLPNKEQPYFMPNGGEIIATGVGKIFFLSAPQAEMTNKFIFPFLAALALYVLGYSISCSRIAGLLCAASVLLGDGNLIGGLSAWKGLLHGVSMNANFLGYDRPVNPEVSGIVLILGLLFPYRIFFVRDARQWESWALALIIGGAIYISPFIYSFLGLFLFLLFLWLLYVREKSLALRAFAIGAGALFCAIPFAFNYHVLTMADGYASSAMRQGLVTSHIPTVGIWLPVILLASLFFWPKRYAQARPLFVLSVLALLILLNQQIITGHILQPGHYHWYITIPLVFIMLSLYASHGIEKFFTNPRWQAIFCALGIAFFFYNASLTQLSSYRAWLPATTEAQRYAPLMQALNNIPGERVVWANQDISVYIPLYSRDDTPNNRQLANYLLPDTYLTERLILTYRLRGVTPQEILATLQQERTDVSSQLYGTYWANQTGSFDSIPDSVLASVADEYKKQYVLPLSEMFKKLDIGIIVWDTETDPPLSASSLPFASRIASIEGINIYQINK